MCLIIHKPEHLTFDERRLRDFWKRNRDGAGIMWNNGVCIEVEKIVAPSVEEWIAFYREFAAKRECVIHLRWRTHGDIDEDNVHPYYMGRGFWLMHNGVLSSGNDADPTRSDTWHFIEDVLKPALRKNRSAFSNPDFREKLGHIINRNNRLVIMGPRTTRPIFINRNSGIMWQGAWFSNTYAWTPPFTDSPKAKAKPKQSSFIQGNPPPQIWMAKRHTL